MAFVWVSFDIAEPPRSGGELRTSRLLTALAREETVHAVVVAREADVTAVQRATGAASVTHVPPCSRAVRKRLRALRTGLSLGAAALREPAAVEAVRSRLGPDDVLVADHLMTASFLRGCDRTVLSLHNADAAALRAEAQPREPVRRLERAWDVAAVARLERKAVAAADLVVSVSQEDHDLVAPARGIVVPNGTDLPNGVGPVPSAGSLLFVGSLSYGPNEDAVRWWVQAVAPLLPADLPPLTVVGRNADRVLADLVDHPLLQVHGDVPAVAPFLEAASVVVVPLRYGGGSRLKLVEAMAYGRPVVSTGKGAEGFPVVDGEHLLLRDDPEGLAAATVQLWRDQEGAQRLADVGVAFAAGYSWDRLAVPFVAALREVARVQSR